MITFLVLLVTVLAIITIVRIMKMIELTSEITGKDDSAINDSDNKFNAWMLLLFLIATIGFFVYGTFYYSKFLLPVSASEHGVSTDMMLNVTFAILIFVFFITQILLFWFGFKYKFNKASKGHFYPDNHKLELIWTAIPTVVLVALVTYGLIVWNNITAPAPKEAMVIQLYGKQFDWTARYAGKDNKLGSSYFRFISNLNVLGVDSTDKTAQDDIITRELHIPVNTPVLLMMNSREVIHSAYLPHFRVQMNAVPGMTTQFHFVPTITTAEMKKITGDENFEYVLLCNKICGVAHFNMKMNVICETQEEFDKWLSTQKSVAQIFTPEKKTEGQMAEAVVSKP